MIRESAGPASVQDQAPDASAGLNRVVVGVAVPSAGPVRDEHLGRPRPPARDPSQVALTQLPGAVGDLLQHRVEVERRVDGAGQVRQHLCLAPPLPSLFVEAGVAERERRLIGERRDEPQILLGEDAPAGVVDGERAEDLTPGRQRYAEPRAVGVEPDALAGALGRRDPRIGEEVGRPPRLAVTDGEA